MTWLIHITLAISFAIFVSSCAPTVTETVGGEVEVEVERDSNGAEVRAKTVLIIILKDVIGGDKK